MLANGMRIVACLPVRSEVALPPSVGVAQQSCHVGFESRQENVVLVWLSGDLCDGGNGWLDGVLSRLRSAGRKRVGIDASRLTGISAKAVDLLLDAASMHRAVGGEFLLFDPPPWMRVFLRACDADNLVAEASALEDRLWRLTADGGGSAHAA